MSHHHTHEHQPQPTQNLTELPVITSFSLNHHPAGEDLRTHVSATGKPVFSWTVQSPHDRNAQTACNIIIAQEDQVIWDSGPLSTPAQQLEYEGPQLPQGPQLTLTLTVSDRYGLTSLPYNTFFYVADIAWRAPWITAPTTDDTQEAHYFRKLFTLEKTVDSARLYVCGIGYQKILLNGEPLDEGPVSETPLDPPVTDYSKQNQYVFYPEIQDQLQDFNCLTITVGRGWRDNDVTRTISEKHPLPMAGKTALTAMLVIDFADGTTQTIVTDETWTCAPGPIIRNDLFHGTTFDARRYDPQQDLHPENVADDTPEEQQEHILNAPKAVLADHLKLGRLTPMQLPPIVGVDDRLPIAQWSINQDCYLDFGQNMAGVIRLRIPGNTPADTEITIQYGEELNQDGTLDDSTSRSAKPIDTYIASGNEDGDGFFQPPFTYHGFRYAKITGLGAYIPPEDVAAVALRNNLDKDSFFTCGNPLLNQIHQNCLETERANIHGLLTDCPQRNERMGWLNDATVRFQAFPYAFHANQIFTKILQDVMDEQTPDGAIACTAPYLYGHQPADPVCSSPLIAVRQALLQDNDTRLLKHAFDACRAWTDFLLSHLHDGIVDYSYYADWAAPQYACLAPENPHSAVTPGLFMSTGFAYYNCRTIADFARRLDRPDLQQLYLQKAQELRQTFLKTWYQPHDHSFATGSMACLTLPLWLDLLPPEEAQPVAQRLRDLLVGEDFKFTTGNICTLLMLEVLTRYGFVDDVYEFMTRDTYPSFGYMIQQEATTVWERFELKQDPRMNSHCHPMYASVYRWFYACLAGIQPQESPGEDLLIRPYFPTRLQSLHASVQTAKGPVTVRWNKRYGNLNLHVTIPFGMTAKVVFRDQTFTCQSGFHVFAQSL